MQTTVTSGRRSRQDNGEGESLRAAHVEVDLDEKDAAKAIERSQDPGLPPSEEDEDGESPREKDWLNRDRAVRKRMTRLERSFNQRMAENEARHQREVAGLRGTINSLQRERTDDDDAAHEAEIEALQKQLEAAIEAGETKTQAKIQASITRKEAAYQTRKQAALMGGAPERKQTKEEKPQERRERRDTTADDEGGPTAEGKRWIGAQNWWDDDEYDIEQAAAIKLDERFIEEGSDPKKPSHYRRIAKALRKKFPKLEIGDPEDDDELDLDAGDDDADDDDEGGERRERSRMRTRRPPVPGFGDRGERGDKQRTKRGNRVDLSTDQIENMRRFGMDPSKDADVMDYARGVDETERADGKRR